MVAAKSSEITIKMFLKCSVSTDKLLPRQRTIEARLLHGQGSLIKEVTFLEVCFAPIRIAMPLLTAHGTENWPRHT